MPTESLQNIAGVARLEDIVGPTTAAQPPSAATAGMLAPSTATGDPAQPPRHLIDLVRGQREQEIADQKVAGAQRWENVKAHPARTGAILAAGAVPGGGIIPSALMGAAGAGTGLVLKRLSDPTSQPLSVPESLGTMATEGGLQGALGAVGKGLSTLGSGLYRGGVALLPRLLKQEFPNLATTGLEEGIALTRRGAGRAEQAVKSSADEADAMIAARAASRPPVAGLLPEGRVAVPLGPIPSPSGGRVALQLARGAQRVPEHQFRALQGLHAEPTVVPVWGGMPAKTAEAATADTVVGAGTVLRPMNAPPGVGKVPGMISLQEATQHVPTMMRETATGALGTAEPALGQTRRLVQLMSKGRQWPLNLVSAQALKRAEQETAHNAYRAMERGSVTRVPTRARFAKTVAQGTREAIEREVPDVAPINARTQALMGLQRAAEHASGTGHILSRLGGAAVPAALLGSGGGLLPAVGGAAAGAALTSPGGLTATGLGVRKVGQVFPNMSRAALLALMTSHGK